MARIRSIKPEFWEDEEVSLVSRDARLLFIATWNAADDEGLLRWSAAFLKSAAFIYDDDLTIRHVGKLMDELVTAGFVVPYKGGKAQQDLGWIPSFRRHQKPNRPQPSKLPPPSLQNPEIRRAYADRDGWRCGLCGEEIPQDGFATDPYAGDGHSPSLRLHIDHINPRAKGGSDYPSNVQAAHQACNCSKCDTVNDTPPTPESFTEPFTEPFTESFSEPNTDPFTPVVEGRGEERRGEPSSSPPVTQAGPDPTPDDDPRVATTLDVLAERDSDRADVRDPAAYFARCRTERGTKDHDAIAALAHDHPNADPDELAELHEPTPPIGAWAPPPPPAGAVTENGRTFLPGTGWIDRA